MVISTIFESIAISEHSFRLFKVNSNFISLSGHCGTDRNELNMMATKARKAAKLDADVTVAEAIKALAK